MAGLTSLLLQFVFRIQTKRIGMERVRELIVLSRVTRDAHGFANVFRSAIQRSGSFRFCGRC